MRGLCRSRGPGPRTGCRCSGLKKQTVFSGERHSSNIRRWRMGGKEKILSPQKRGRKITSTHPQLKRKPQRKNRPEVCYNFTRRMSEKHKKPKSEGKKFVLGRHREGPSVKVWLMMSVAYDTTRSFALWPTSDATTDTPPPGSTNNA